MRSVVSQVKSADAGKHGSQHRAAPALQVDVDPLHLGFSFTHLLDGSAQTRPDGSVMLHALDEKTSLYTALLSAVDSSSPPGAAPSAASAGTATAEVSRADAAVSHETSAPITAGGDDEDISDTLSVSVKGGRRRRKRGAATATTAVGTLATPAPTASPAGSVKPVPQPPLVVSVGTRRVFKCGVWSDHIRAVHAAARRQPWADSDQDHEHVYDEFVDRGYLGDGGDGF